MDFKLPSIQFNGYHLDVVAGLTYLSAPAFATSFVVFGHKWFLVAAAISIAAGALRTSIVQQSLPAKAVEFQAPVIDNGTQVGHIVCTKIAEKRR